MNAWFRAIVLLGGTGFLLRRAARITVADLDMFHEMALFREALSIGRIPWEDSFAYVPTVSPVVHHEWGTGVVLYFFAVTTGWGLTGIGVLHWLLLGAIAVATYRVATRNGGHDLVVALLAGAGASLLAPGLSPVRAQLFTYLFVVLMLLLAPRHEQLGLRFVALWLALFVVWLNMHGGFVVGFGLFGLYVAERLMRTWLHERSWRTTIARHRHLLAAAAAMPPLLLVNPYGVHYPPYVLSALTLDRPYIAEWAPLWDPRVGPLLVLVFGVSLFLVAYAMAHRRVAELHGLPMLAAAAVFTLQHQRLAPVYGILWFCLLPGYLRGTPLERLLLRWGERRRIAVALVALGIALFGIATVIRERPWNLRMPETAEAGTLYYPVGAVQHLAEHGFTGNLMTPFDAGAYVSWMLYPQVLVSLDSRYEVAYPPEMLEESFRFYSAQTGWEAILDRYPTDAVLVPVTAAVDAALRARQHELGWSEAYRDAGFAVYERTGGSEAGRR